MLYFVSECLVYHVLLRELVTDNLLVKFFISCRLLLGEGQLLVILLGLELLRVGEVGLQDGREGVELSAGRASSDGREEQVDGPIGGVAVST